MRHKPIFGGSDDALSSLVHNQDARIFADRPSHRLRPLVLPNV
jgi:hypothetical protein